MLISKFAWILVKSGNNFENNFCGNNFENNRWINKEFPERISGRYKSIIDLSLHTTHEVNLRVDC